MEETKQPGEANSTKEPEVTKPKSRRSAKVDEPSQEVESATSSTDVDKRKLSVEASRTEGAEKPIDRANTAVREARPAERMRFRRSSKR